MKIQSAIVLGFLLFSNLGIVSYGQFPGRGSAQSGLYETFSQYGVKVGDPLPDITLVDAEGEPFPLENLKGNHTVIVFGCLT